MNIFIVYSFSDREKVDQKLKEMHKKIYNLHVVILNKDRKIWKLYARMRIKKAQLIVFFIGEDSHDSPSIKWELNESKKLGKRLLSVKLAPENKEHPSLLTNDKFTGVPARYDKEVEFNELVTIVKNYENGDYNVFNMDFKDMDFSLLLEQYKLFLQTSETLVERRQMVNNFYITVNSAIVAISSGIIALQIDVIYKLLIGLAFSVMGIVLCGSWIQILASYGNLNSSKLKIIRSIEKHLPASLYDAEWSALSDKLNSKKYISFTNSEQRIPKLFTAMYTVLVCLLIALVLFNGGII